MSFHKTVRRRKVFYIPGFDPFPPRRYRELYRSEAKKQADFGGYSISQEILEVEDGFGWRVTGQIDDVTCVSDIEVLVWSDIVKSTMSGGILSTYLHMIRTAWIYLSTGTLWDIVQLRKGPVIAALYPIGFLCLQFLLALGLVWALQFILSPILGWGSYVAFAGIWPILSAFRRWDGKIFAYYLMQDYAHSAQAYGAYPRSLRERLSQFSDRVEQAINDENWDEILVVGHSSGAHLGTTVLSDVIARAQLEQKRVSLSFLTLGQVFPMVSFLPNADELRRDMVRVGNCASITWVDVSAPGDGCSFALCDPLAVTGLATPEQKGPLILSAAFSQTLKPQTWAQLRWRFFRLHFQYLCAFDNARDYDYFQITAGPLTLAQRYDGRAASQSRIVMPIARHRGMAQ